MGATTVTGTIRDVANELVIGKYVTFRLVSVGTDSGTLSTVDATPKSALTDANGQISQVLWDNGDSGVESVLEIRMPSGQREDVIIPAATATIDIWDLLENHKVDDSDPQLPTNQDSFLQVANNLSDVASASTARTNIGAAAPADTLQVANNLSDVADAAAARANLGVPSEAEGLAAVNNLSDVASASTSRTNLGVSATADTLLVANDLSDLNDPAAARANLGVTSSGDGLVAANNLSDVASPSTSRTNLGLGTAATTASTAYATAAQGATADTAIQTASIDVTVQGYTSILAATTAAFTTAEETKLAGIDTGAEVNDPTTLLETDIQTTVTDTDTEITSGSAVVAYSQPISQSDVWTFSNSTTSEDPGSGNFRLNNGTQSSATEIYISKESKSGESHDFSDLVVGSEFRATEAGSLNGHTFEATGSFTDNTTWISVPVTVINSLGSLGNNKDSVFQQVFGAASFGNQRNLTSPTTLVDTTSYTILPEDRVLLIDDDTAGGDVTISLPAAAVALDGWAVTIKKLGSTADVILETNGSETIDGDLTRIIRQKLESTCLVSDGTNWRVMFPTTPTGWAVYDDATYTSGSPLIPSSGVRTQLTIDGLGSTTNTDFLPAGVTAFWDTTNDKITPQKVGDAYDVRVDFTVDVPANTESILLELDIGDGSPDIPIIRRTVAYSESGAGQSFSVGFPIFALDTFLANGGKLYVTTSAAGFDLYDISVFVKRDFSPL